MLNKGKGKRYRKGKGKGKDKGGKDGKTVTCDTCGQQGHNLSQLPNEERRKRKQRTDSEKGQRPYYGQWSDGKGYQQPQSHGYQQNGYVV
eukprot:5978892-Amphidinium_carterae.2